MFVICLPVTGGILRTFHRVPNVRMDWLVQPVQPERHCSLWSTNGRRTVHSTLNEFEGRRLCGTLLKERILWIAERQGTTALRLHPRFRR